MESMQSKSKQAATSVATTMQNALKSGQTTITDVQSMALLNDIQSGDSAKQVEGLTGALALLAAGRDVGLHVSATCQHILISPNTTPTLKRLAYDLARSAALTDADWARIVGGVGGDLAKGTHTDVRSRAMKMLPLFPPHYLADLLLRSDGALFQRVVLAVRSVSDAVRIAAIESLADLTLTSAPHVLLEPASQKESLRATLQQGWLGICRAVCDDADLVSATACTALTRLFKYSTTSSTMSSGEQGSASSVKALMTDLITNIQITFSASFTVTFARLCKLSSMLVVNVPPLLVNYLRSLELPPDQRELENLPGDMASVARAGHAVEETVAFLVDMLRCVNPAAVLAAVEGLMELAGMDAACTVVQAALPQAVSALLAAAGSTDKSRLPSPPSAQPAILLTLLDGLKVLPRIQQALLFRKLPVLITAMSSGTERTWAFVQVWSAVLDFDWSSASLIADPASNKYSSCIGPVAQLHQMLQEPAVKDFVSGGTLSRSSSSIPSSPPPPPPPPSAMQRQSSKKRPSSSSSRKQKEQQKSYMRDPAIREELVSSLLYVLWTHVRGGRSSVGAAAAAAATEEENGDTNEAAAATSGSHMGTAASGAVVAASRLQSLTEQVQWMESSKTALTGTKASLGWDSVAAVSTTGSTVVQDIWLQLLLRCLKVVKILQKTLNQAVTTQLNALAAVHKSRVDNYTPPIAIATPSNTLLNGDGTTNINTDQPPPPLPPPDIPPETKALIALRHRVNNVETEMQGLLLQIATNWRALHPVCRARALWVCTFHLKLKNVLDAGWTSLVDAVRGLLATNKGGGYALSSTAVAQGLLAYGAIAINSKGGSGAKQQQQQQQHGSNKHAAALASAGWEHVEIALLCLERLVSLLSYNHKEKLHGRLSAPGGLIEKVVKVELELSPAPHHAERLLRMQSVLGPIASGGREGGGRSTGTTSTKVGTISLRPATTVAIRMPSTTSAVPSSKKKSSSKQQQQQQEDAAAKNVVVVDLQPDPDQPLAAAYPTTLPSAGALSKRWETKRYSTLMEELQTAVWRIEGGDTGTTGGTGSGVMSEGFPTLSQLTEILTTYTNTATTYDGDVGEGDGSSSSAAGATAALWQRKLKEVTGPSSPVSLHLAHSVDRQRQCIYLHCAVTNKTKETLTGISVELTLGGPLAHGHRRPLLVAVKSLPPSDSFTWDSTLGVSGFGWPIVQPRLALPAKVPLGVGDPVVRCLPYHISPLELLAPPRRAATASEFYQRWQALPYRVRIQGQALLPGTVGVRRALEALNKNENMVNVYISSTDTPVHATYHGMSWQGETIALIVTSGTGELGGKLLFHFGSESDDIVSRIQAHQAELLEQLTSGLVAPHWSDASGTTTGTMMMMTNCGGTGGGGMEDESSQRPPGTFSFFKSMASSSSSSSSSDEEEEGEEEENDDGDGAKYGLERAAMSEWEKLRKLRIITV
jgi:hypothetical protein